MTDAKPIVMCVVGARPNFMKIAPIMRALRASIELEVVLVHTGQHYDSAMNDVFFEELEIAAPDYFLAVGSGTHAEQTANVMLAIEPVIDKLRPSLLLVVGDVNSTIAAALVAAKKGIKIAHVEAGLRSFDMTMPEEINRLLTDRISDVLYTTEPEAARNLLREGVPKDRVCFVGNVMIDTLLHSLPRATPAADTLADTSIGGDLPDGFALATIHRPSNVDEPAALRNVLSMLRYTAALLPVVFPMHPRTRNAIERFELTSLLDHPRIAILPPASYLVILGLMQGARVVITDSGGVQEETTGLGVPCLTLRESTERPITAESGTNTIVGVDRDKFEEVLADVLTNGGKSGRRPDLWDGKSAERIVADLERRLAIQRDTDRAVA